MGDSATRNIKSQDKVYRTVNGLDEKSIVYQHKIRRVTEKNVYVTQKPESKEVMGFYKTRKGGVYVLDRETLEEEGQLAAEYGTTQTSFYLSPSDIEEDVKPPGEAEKEIHEPNLRLLPVEKVHKSAIDHFDKIGSELDGRYNQELSGRLLFEAVLEVSLVDLLMHGKDSSLVEQLDSISLAGGKTGQAKTALRPLPVEQIHKTTVEQFNKAAASLAKRYGGGFPKRRLIEVSLRQVFADLAVHQEESPLIARLDAFAHATEVDL